MKPLIKIDHREMHGSLARHLNNADLEIELVKLDSGDVEIGDRIVIERKRYSDLCRSIIDGRLFKQASRLNSAGPRPLFLIEFENEHSENMHSNAAKGALSSIMVDFGIPVLFSNNTEETVQLIELIANRESKRQQKLLKIIKKRFSELEKRNKKEVFNRYTSFQKQGEGTHCLNEEKKCLDEVQELILGFSERQNGIIKEPSFDLDAMHILSAFPGIGPKLSMRLLAYFGSLQQIMNADEEALHCAGLSPAKSLHFRRILTNQSPMTMTRVRN